MNSSTLISAVESVTQKWTKQRKAEERGRARSRIAAFTRLYPMTIKAAAWKVMEKAYMKTSDGGTLPAMARQLMYQARGRILKMTGRDSLDDQYFTQKLIPEYIRDHPKQTASWDVVYDARGHLAEPHTDVIVPVGTLDVRQYLNDIRDHAVEAVGADSFHAKTAYPTCGPKLRFAAIMFIEK
ncbi:MAG: hypothetical protein ABIP48_21490 [Planctomycetota bacterium]